MDNVLVIGAGFMGGKIGDHHDAILSRQQGDEFVAGQRGIRGQEEQRAIDDKTVERFPQCCKKYASG